MSAQLESALIIALEDSLKWGAALPSLQSPPGTLTPINPGQVLDIVEYARRDRELQHRDMINAAAVVKVAIHATTVWSGTVVRPIIQGTTGVYDASGTNVTMYVDPAELPIIVPFQQGTVQYVIRSDVPYAAVQKTDKDLHSRDLLIYETLARAAAIFPNNPPIIDLDPNQAVVGSTSIWPTAHGVDNLRVPNAAEPLAEPLFREPDQYLSERDNQVVAYASRVCQALKNPFEYASRIYVGVSGTESREPETYALTPNVFLPGQVYAAGEQVTTNGTNYEALNTTSDIPPSSNWMGLPEPTIRQFIAEPSLSSRNRILYDTEGRTLQWFRETLDTVHVPQIVGFMIPGVLPGQFIDTVPLVPEQKDAQFWRRKAARVCIAAGTWADLQTISPLSVGSGTINGTIHTVFEDVKMTTAMIPDKISANFDSIPLGCSSGTYTLNCLVRPATTVEIAGGDNQQGSQDPLDNGVDFIPVTGTTFNWQIPLPAGGWALTIEFANHGTAATTSFPVTAFQNGQGILSNALPLYYTDSFGNPLPQFTVADSQPIQIISTGQSYNFGITWVGALPGSGQQFHVSRLRFNSTDDRQTSHYIMVASWRGHGTAVLDVYGQHEMPDVMPFQFYLSGTDTHPIFDITWVPKTASAWVAQAYNTGDQVLFNLIYWQAIGPTQASDIPGQSALWEQLATEPQIPLIFEQIQLQKLRATIVTPETQGFEGFRQDMLERALRANVDAYSLHLSQVGTNFPEFRLFGSIWDLSATGSWMTFMEVYAPRLREFKAVTSIIPGHQYEVVGPGSIVYNATPYHNSDRFFGVAGVTTFTPTGQVTVNHVGAYRLSQPGDLGNTALVPAGLEYNQETGTIFAWYPSYASLPTHQAVQPWMIEAGLFAASNDFFSPDGNLMPPGN